MVLFTLAIGLLVTDVPSAMAGKYGTISDIREEVKDGWHETYEAQGRTIVVDIDIDVPEVDMVPAVRVAVPQTPFAQKVRSLDNTSEVSVFVEGFWYKVCDPNHSIFSSWADSEAQVLYGPDARAENSPLSREEAVEFCLSLVEQYEDVFGPQDLEVRFLFPYTCAYKILSKGFVNELDMNTPLTETGWYSICFYQRFHGIPYLRPGGPFLPRIPPQGCDAPLGDISAVIATKEDYNFGMCPAIEDSVAVDDLPLSSFALAKAEFEKRIQAGYIREVYSVRLGYMAYYDPDNLDTYSILLPIWELRGSIVDEPRFNPPAPPAGLEEYYRLLGGQEAMVNAQTGVLLDPKDSSEKRGWAKIITWDQVE
jgi:hypothetical protein